MKPIVSVDLLVAPPSRRLSWGVPPGEGNALATAGKIPALQDITESNQFVAFCLVTIGSMTDSLIIAGREFRSRLIVGTGKYKSFQETARVLEASGAEMVTVAVRRVNLDRSKESLLDYIDGSKYFLLPNTAGCYTADEAIRAARLGREVGLSDWVKLEVIGDQATLYPDVQVTLEATQVLVKEGFTVLPYTSDDIVFAKRLLDAGASAIMPLGAPIGSGLGIQNAAHIRIMREMITGVPLILDAGVGTASDAVISSAVPPTWTVAARRQSFAFHGIGLDSA